MTSKLLLAAACGLLLSASVEAAEIKMLASGAVQDAYTELVPQFEKASGHKVAITWAGTVDIKKKVAAGEQFDLVVCASPEMEAFVKDGKIIANSKVDLVKSSVGIAVKAGAPKPDVSSGEALKQALLNAKSIAYSTGPSGVYMASLIEKMGIAEQVKAKTKITPPGVRVATLVRDGEAEIGFQQVSELIHEAGIDLIGPISADVQKITVFSSGVPTAAKAQIAARELQKYLNAPATAPVIKKHGLDRVPRAVPPPAG